MSAAQHLLRTATWVFGDESVGPLVWGREQALALTEKLCASRARTSSAIDAPFSIVVGTPATHAVIRRAVERGQISLDSLGEDDYRILEIAVDAKTALLVAGRNDRAAMYGLFGFFEALGCRFLLSRDVLPDVNPDLAIPPLDITGRTHCSWRGLFLQFCFVGNSIMSLCDYERLFGQMAKMRMNRVLYYHFENEPFMDYSYAGERRLLGDVTHPQSGYMSLGRQDAGTYRTADMIVGRERFDRQLVAPLEFQQVRNSPEALDKGRFFMQELIRMAARCGIGTWISFDSSFVSLNLAKYTRRLARPIELYCSLTSFTDPVASEINRNRIESIVEAYPDIEGILFQITEGAYEDPYPDSQAIIDREWPKYQESFELLKKHWGKWWKGEETQRTFMRADIGFVERMQQSLAAAREIRPSLRLGVLTVCKAYLLTYLDQVLPKDMPFVDIESQSLWTVDGAPLHLFQRMKGRECVIVPRACDDGSLAGLQFDLNLYQRDGFLASRRKNGTSGLAVQTTHVTGNEHNVRFLAEGMWNEELTPDAFYRDYAERLFGAAAVEPMMQAFRILEANEAALGGRGLANMPYNLNPREISMIREVRNHPTPFFSAPWNAANVQTLADRADRFAQAIASLDAALIRFETAGKTCRPQGRPELDYLSGKTRGYRRHLLTLCLLKDFYARYVQAFGEFDANRLQACREGLQEACSQAALAEESAMQSAREFAGCIAHPTDLAVLWMMNHVIVATRVIRQFTQNVVAYHEGREYWNKVDWELLYDTSPFPVYQVQGQNTLVLG